jgi:ElaB/YqjD/DUF883 family membrane-anchored ribosome-binding protein
MSTKELIKKLRTGLTSCIASVLVWALVCSAIPARADNSVTGGEAQKEVLKVVILEHGGNPGYWFPREKAIALQKDVEELQELRKLVKLTDEQLTVKVERLKLQKEIAATNEKAATVAKNNLEKAVRLRREAEEDRDSFFAGKPWFWVAIGALAGVVTSVLLLKE